MYAERVFYSAVTLKHLNHIHIPPPLYIERHYQAPHTVRWMPTKDIDVSIVSAYRVGTDITGIHSNFSLEWLFPWSAISDIIMLRLLVNS